MRLAALLFLCLASAITATARASTPIDGNWRFVEIKDAHGFDPAKTEFVVLAGGGVALTVGCNRMRADFKLDGGSLTFGPIASTRMLCAPPLSDLEQKAGRALEATRRYEIGAECQLRLLDAAGGLLARLAKAK